MSNNKKSLVIASILIISVIVIAFAGMAITKTGPFDSGSSIGIQVVDDYGFPMVNASVQGMIEIPPSEGNGTAFLFAGVTNSGGMYSVKNMSPVHEMASRWISYNARHNNAFQPYIIVFLTYKVNNATYTQQTSIRLTPEALLHGESYHAYIHAGKGFGHRLIPDKMVKVHPLDLKADGISGSSENMIPDANLNNPPPSRLNGNNIFEIWYQTNATLVHGNNSSPLKIPLAQGETYGAGSVEAGEVLYAESKTTDVMGQIINPYSSSNVQISVGTSNGVNTGAYTIAIDQYSGVTNPNGYGWSYAYIRGNLTVANYELYEIHYNPVTRQSYYVPTGEFQTDIAITQIVHNASSIMGGLGKTQPTYYPEQQPYITLKYHNNSWPVTGDSGVYEISAWLIYNHITNYAALAGIGIGAGAMVLGVATLGIGDAAAVAATVGGIALSALGDTLAFIQWGSQDMDYAVSWIEYSSASSNPPELYIGYTSQDLEVDGASIQVPTVFAYVYAQPDSPSSGGGCVLTGTNITLADGSSIMVQNLHPGMKTLSYDVQTGKLMETTVTSVIENNVSMITSINNGELFVSGMEDQPIFVKLPNGTEEWLTVGQLTTSMELFNPLNNNWTQITNLTILFGNFTVYDIHTARNFNNNGSVRSDYIANGFLLDKKLA